ncbi:hypothetical protein DB30_03311 [Enhygromyxa salina]|uniref:Uncharacterized protein n=1 Tax=Enhygromyxa salina TaxID=215803 RepID=A0A0C2DCF1_9BACT|nr:hypothetical protein DB30_03311 [Enhygromyxa salina]
MYPSAPVRRKAATRQQRAGGSQNGSRLAENPDFPCRVVRSRRARGGAGAPRRLCVDRSDLVPSATHTRQEKFDNSGIVACRPTLSQVSSGLSANADSSHELPAHWGPKASLIWLRGPHIVDCVRFNQIYPQRFH